MPEDAITIASLRNMAEGGYQYMPPDTGTGMVYRPTIHGPVGGRFAPVDSMFTAWIDVLNDPDQSLQRNPAFFERLAMHPDVQGAIRKRERNVASFPDSILPNPRAKDRNLAKLVANYVGDIWSKLPDRCKMYEWMQRAVLFGGSGLEFIWQRDNTGSSPIEFPVMWYPMTKSRFVFDRLGNLAIKTRETPVWGSYVEMNPVTQALWRAGQSPPGGKFLYHVYRQEAAQWEQPDLEGYVYYGIGECVPLYYVVTFDWYVLNQRVEWLQTYARPPRILYYPEGDPATSQTDAVVAAAMNQAIINMPRPPGMDKESWFALEQFEVPSASYDAMDNFQSNWSRPKINIILLGSAEEQQQEEGKGGYSSHVSRHETGPKQYYAYDAMCIESTINRFLIPFIVKWRFPNMAAEYMPRLHLDCDQGRDIKQEIENLAAAQKLGIPISLSYARQQSGIPKPEDGEELLQAGMDAGGSPPPGEPPPEGMRGKGEIGANGAPEAAANDHERGMPRHNGQPIAA